MNKLDFRQLPALDNKRPLLCQLGDKRTNSLKTFNHVFERADCALYFTAKFHSESNQIIKKGLLRAAISEFVSIEEVIKIDSKINNISLPHLLIINTENPLLHIVKQLRNYNIHLGSSVIEYTEETKRTFGTIDNFTNGTGYEYSDSEAIITNLNIVEFDNLRDAKHYCNQDKIDLINWFNQNQIKWGVDHLIYLATLDYCDRIIAYYNLT
ncbi:MAG: hypothetical protein LC117_10425 [Bacteroidia bacterium]|nr:hypothetical protein [Bacteroidia bacterium]